MAEEQVVAEASWREMVEEQIIAETSGNLPGLFKRWQSRLAMMQAIFRLLSWRMSAGQLHWTSHTSDCMPLAALTLLFYFHL